MLVKFSIYDWRDIIGFIGSATDQIGKRELLRYVELKCENNRFSAFGADGYHIHQLRGKCEMSEDTPVHVLFQPVKAPAKTAMVALFLNVSPENHLICFYDKNNEMTGSENIPIVKDAPFGLEEKFVKPNIDELAKRKYWIAVNPKHLVDTLSAMKDYEAVIMEFTEPVRPFVIHPYRPDEAGMDGLSIELPVRIGGGVGEY